MAGLYALVECGSEYRAVLYRSEGALPEFLFEDLVDFCADMTGDDFEAVAAALLQLGDYGLERMLLGKELPAVDEGVMLGPDGLRKRFSGPMGAYQPAVDCWEQVDLKKVYSFGS